MAFNLIQTVGFTLPDAEPSRWPRVNAQAGVHAPRRLRLLIVNWRCPRHPRAGGAETHLDHITRNLVRLGHSVTVITSGWPGAPVQELMQGVQYHRVGSEYSFIWRHRRTLRRLCETQAFDLLIDDISKMPLALPARRSAPRAMAWCHHIHGPTLYRQLPRPLAWLIDRAERRMPTRYGDTPMLAVSPSTRHELIELGFTPSRLGLVPNGVDSASIRRYVTDRSTTPLLIYLGRLQRYKNVDCVLRAFARIRARMPEAQLVVLGTGHDQPRLQQLAHRITPNGVYFRGYVTEAEKNRWLHQAWVALASSQKEGWGICILEANAAGTPVIASDVPGHRDAVRHGETGLLCPYDDDVVMADHALACLQDAARLRRLAENARRWADQFDWQASTRTFLQWVTHFFPELGDILPPSADHGRSATAGNAPPRLIVNTAAAEPKRVMVEV